MLNKILSIFGYKPKEDSPPKTEAPKPEEPKKDISEPVISFINTLKANPRRFKIVWLNRGEYEDSIYLGGVSFMNTREYVLVDKVSGEKFLFKKYGQSVRNYYDAYSLPAYLTNDEQKWVIDEVQSVFIQKGQALRDIRQQRASRGHQKERNRLKEVYCGN